MAIRMDQCLSKTETTRDHAKLRDSPFTDILKGGEGVTQWGKGVIRQLIMVVEGRAGKHYTITIWENGLRGGAIIRQFAIGVATVISQYNNNRSILS